MRVILIFNQSGELYKQLQYKTKGIAKKHFLHFLKNGIIDPNTGETIKNLKYELL